MKSANDMTPYDVYFTVASHETKNFIFAVIGTVFTYWLAGAWRSGAIALFCIFTVLTLFDGLQAIASYSDGRNARRAATQAGVVMEGERWLWAAWVVRMGGFLLALGLLYVLYQRIW